jgi:hypothetical protein
VFPTPGVPVHEPYHRAVLSLFVMLVHTSFIGASNLRVNTKSLPSSRPVGFFIPSSPSFVDPLRASRAGFRALTKS